MLLFLVYAMTTLSFGSDRFKPHQWEQRLLLVQLPSDEWQEFKAQCEVVAGDLSERRLLLYVTTGPAQAFRWQAQPESKEPLDEAWAEAISSLLPESAQFALVGLDGGVKASYSKTNFSFEELFRRIDAMPMRAREIRDRE